MRAEEVDDRTLRRRPADRGPQPIRSKAGQLEKPLRPRGLAQHPGKRLKGDLGGVVNGIFTVV